MSKSNYTVIDSEGNNRTYYGCATVAEACQLGDVSTSNVSKRADQLLVFKDCFENPEYGVTVKDNSVIGYAVNQAVAYEDLIPYQETGLLQKTNTQLLGVLSINSNNNGLYEMALSPQEGNTDNCLIVNTSSSLPDMLPVNPHQFAQKQQTGSIEVFISPTALTMAGSVYNYNISGLDIVLCDFIDNIDDLDNLMIDHIKITDLYTGGEEGSSNIHSGNQDNSGFNIPETQYETIVASSGDQKVCAFTKGQSPYQSSLMQKYTNWPSQTTQINFMLQFGQTIQTRQVDVLVTTLEVGITYKNADHVKQVKTLFINIWFKAGTQEFDNDPSISVPESNDILKFPDKSILYTTSDNQELEEYDDELAQKFGNGQKVISHGYNKMPNGEYLGWITYENVPTSIGFIQTAGNYIFRHNKKITSVIIPEGVKSINYGAFFDCTSLRTCSFPSTISDICNSAFEGSGICELDFSNVAVSLFMIYNKAFKDCKNLVHIKACPSGIHVGDAAFYGCVNLSEIEFPQSKEEIHPFGDECFAHCGKLKTNVLKYTKSYFDYIGSRAFYNCVSLSNISIQGFITRYITVWSLNMLWNLIPITAIYSAVSGSIKAALEGKDAYTFENCTGLKTVYIENVEDGEYQYSPAEGGFAQSTFLACSNVEAIYCNSHHPPFLGGKNIWEKGAINPKTCKLYVPVDRKHAYNSKAQWGDFPLDSIIEYTPEQFEEVKQQLLAEQ